MNKRKYLRKAIDPDSPRPALQWGHVFTIDSHDIVMTTDGYRLHAVWLDENETDLKPVCIGDHRFITFDKSRDWTDGAAKFNLNTLDNFTAVVRPHTEPVTVELMAWEIRRILKAFDYANFGALYLNQGKAYLVFKDVSVIVPIKVRCENMPDKPVWFGFTTGYLRKTIPVRHTYFPITFDAANHDRPLFIGTWGEAIAVLMPTGGDSEEDPFQKVLSVYKGEESSFSFDRLAA